jgi:microcystin synthetase protein McyA
LIEHCLSPDAGGYTPSDFPVAQLNQQELDDILAEID